MPSFSCDNAIDRHLRRQQYEICEIDDSMIADKERDKTDQYYNDKKIIDSMGAEKGTFEISLPAEKDSLSASLPFLANSKPDLEVFSPHADNLDIEDLDDVESVQSDRSD